VAIAHRGDGGAQVGTPAVRRGPVGERGQRVAERECLDCEARFEDAADRRGRAPGRVEACRAAGVGELHAPRGVDDHGDERVGGVRRRSQCHRAQQREHQERPGQGAQAGEQRAAPGGEPCGAEPRDGECQRDAGDAGGDQPPVQWSSESHVRSGCRSAGQGVGRRAIER
jgi:hypothetical protein